MTNFRKQQFARPLAKALLTALVLLIAGVWPSYATSDQDALFEALRNASSEAEAKAVEAQIWETWLDAAPSPEIRSKVDKAMARREQYDFEGARLILNEVVEEASGYPEGWNQRAFVYFLQGNYDASLEDIERVLELEPRHFGALSGKAMIFMAMGRVELGQNALRAAVDIHPFLNERNLLVEPKGIDL